MALPPASQLPKPKTKQKPWFHCQVPQLSCSLIAFDPAKYNWDPIKWEPWHCLAWRCRQQQALNSGSLLEVQRDCHLLVVTHLPLASTVAQLDSESCAWNTTWKGRVLGWLLGHGLSGLLRVLSVAHPCHWVSQFTQLLFTECLSCAQHTISLSQSLLVAEELWKWRASGRSLQGTDEGQGLRRQPTSVIQENGQPEQFAFFHPFRCFLSGCVFLSVVLRIWRGGGMVTSPASINRVFGIRVRCRHYHLNWWHHLTQLMLILISILISKLCWKYEKCLYCIVKILCWEHKHTHSYISMESSASVT